MASPKDDKVVSVDEGGVFNGPTPDGEFSGPQPNKDEGGIFDQTPGDKPLVKDGKDVVEDKGVVLGIPKVKTAKADTIRTFVFTNTRYPDQRIALIKEGDGGRRQRTGRRVAFQSTKLATTDPAAAQQVRDLNRPYIFEEPANYIGTDPNADSMFLHKSTGFRTMVKKAYEDWVDNSEWSAKPR